MEMSRIESGGHLHLSSGSLLINLLPVNKIQIYMSQETDSTGECREEERLIMEQLRIALLNGTSYWDMVDIMAAF